MALRPGSSLLQSSHFMPLPRSRMILASSVGLHLDCFLARGEWMGCSSAGSGRLWDVTDSAVVSRLGFWCGNACAVVKG